MQQFKQNKNVLQTIGESMVVEGHLAAKHGIAQIPYEFVSCLTPQNWHARTATRIVERPVLCRMEDVFLK